jgi:hypothetical protein
MAPPAPGSIQRVDYIFADPTDLLPAAAWTETFYVGGTTQDVFDRVTRPIDFQARTDLLHNNYALAQINVSDVVVLRDSIPFNLGAAAGAGRYPLAGGHVELTDDSEEPWDGVLVQMQNAARNSRRFFAMRGLPVGVVVNNFRYVGNAVWNPRFDRWKDRHCSVPGGPGPVTPYLLQKRDFTLLAPPTTITVGVDGRSLVLTWAGGIPAAITTQFNINPGPGAFVELKNVYGADKINTIWRIISLDPPNSVHTVRHQRVIFTPGLSGAWVCRLVGYTYPPIAFLDPVRGAKRNTGGPSRRLHGRARTR